MIEVMLTQTVRVSCDRCGKPATEEWFAKVDEARHAAFITGEFHESRWKEGECHRELWLCPQCHQGKST